MNWIAYLWWKVDIRKIKWTGLKDEARNYHMILEQEYCFDHYASRDITVFLCWQASVIDLHITYSFTLTNIFFAGLPIQQLSILANILCCFTCFYPCFVSWVIQGTSYFSFSLSVIFHSLLNVVLGWKIHQVSITLDQYYYLEISLLIHFYMSQQYLGYLRQVQNLERQIQLIVFLFLSLHVVLNELCYY